MRDLIPLTDEEIEARFNHQCAVDNLIFTQDTIADFLAARGGYNEAGRVRRHEADELHLDNVQLRRGEPRRELTVIDFGSCRAVLLL